jgi:hypothetical protein
MYRDEFTIYYFIFFIYLSLPRYNDIIIDQNVFFSFDHDTLLYTLRCSFHHVRHRNICYIFITVADRFRSIFDRFGVTTFTPPIALINCIY